MFISFICQPKIIQTTGCLKSIFVISLCFYATYIIFYGRLKRYVCQLSTAIVFKWYFNDDLCT